ncbi:MAG: M13 family peptidase, partial [Acidobacteriaceae bacterium]
MSFFTRSSAPLHASLALIASMVLVAPIVLAQDTTAATNSPDTHGIRVDNMDRSVKPGDNFYQYANGAWIARTEIPSDRAGIGVFSTLADQSSKNVAAIIEEEAKSSAPTGSNARKIADLYNAYMDEARIESLGMKPLAPHLAAIAAIHNQRELALALGKTLRADVDLLNNAVFSTPNFLGLWIAPGFKDSDHYIPYLLQGGLEMPSASYYLADSEHMKEVRTKYATHVAA